MAGGLLRCRKDMGLLRKDRQADEKNFHAVERAQHKILPSRERRVFAHLKSIDGAFAAQDEADLDASARGLCPSRVRFEPDDCHLQPALGEDTEELFRQTRLFVRSPPPEARGLDQDGLAVARRWINELALVHVLPDRLEAVLVALLAG